MPTINKIPRETIPDDDVVAKLEAQLTSGEADNVAKAKEKSEIAMINAISRLFVKFIDIFLFLILIILTMLVVIILCVYTFYLAIDFGKLNAFLNIAWKTISCGSPFVLSFILLQRYKK